MLLGNRAEYKYVSNSLKAFSQTVKCLGNGKDMADVINVLSREIMKLLTEINEKGTTVVVVTHDREMVNLMKKRVIAMRKGVIVSDERNAGYDHAN